MRRTPPRRAAPQQDRFRVPVFQSRALSHRGTKHTRPRSARRQREKSVGKDLDALLELVGLADKRSSLPGKLSGGEQQRVAIARGLISRPEIILLDEPTGNLDSVNSEGIMRLLSQINSDFGTTIIQVTHNEKNALYGTRVITISDGKIVSSEDIPSRIRPEERSE